MSFGQTIVLCTTAIILLLTIVGGCTYTNASWDRQETARMSNCLESGGQWKYLPPNDDSRDYKYQCVK